MTTARKPMPLHPPAPVGTEPLLTIEGAAGWLGVSPRQVSRWMADRQHPLPAVRLGRRVLRFRVESLARWAAEEEEGAYR